MILTLTPAEEGVIRAVNKLNCRVLFDANKERVRHFAGRVVERGLTDRDVVIVLVNVDDPHGTALADVLMPGHDWQPHRERGEIPIARGLAGRPGIEEAVDIIDHEAGVKLRGANGLCVVVVDQGTAEIYRAEDA